MTDRQVGGADLNVDLRVDPQRQVAAEGLTVDVHPVEAQERQVASSVLQADVTVPLGIQCGAALLSVELVTNPARWLGHVGLMVDYVAELITAGIGWSGTQFVASGGTPVLWGAAAFQTSGGYPPVQWEDGVFKT